MYLFLDESGDLGFNLKKQGTSKYFIIAGVACSNEHIAKQIRQAIKKTLQNKINFKNKHYLNELKGIYTITNAEKYFYNKMFDITGWSINALIIDKEDFQIPKYIAKKNLYDFFAGLLLEKIYTKKLFNQCTVVIDRSKTLAEIKRFNSYIEGIMYPKLGHNNLAIYHKESHNEKALQAADMFSYGIFKKYEHNDLSWYDNFRDFIALEYLG